MFICICLQAITTTVHEQHPPQNSSNFFRPCRRRARPRGYRCRLVIALTDASKSPGPVEHWPGRISESPAARGQEEAVTSNGPGGLGFGPGHTRPGPASAAPSGSRRRRRRAACPPCCVAPTSAGCRPQRPRRSRAGRGRRQFREAGDGAVVGPPVEHRPAYQRGAQVAGRRRIDREACRRDR